MGDYDAVIDEKGEDSGDILNDHWILYDINITLIWCGWGIL